MQAKQHLGPSLSVFIDSVIPTFLAIKALFFVLCKLSTTELLKNLAF